MTESVSCEKQKKNDENLWFEKMESQVYSWVFEKHTFSYLYLDRSGSTVYKAGLALLRIAIRDRICNNWYLIREHLKITNKLSQSLKLA